MSRYRALVPIAPPTARLRGRYFGAAASASLALLRGDSARAVRLFQAIPDSLCLVGERSGLAERLGEREKALTAYRFVAEAWREADPELRRYVDEAQAGLLRLKR
jgi:hypothetical protein